MTWILRFCCWCLFCLFSFLTSTTRLYRGRVPRQSVWQFYVLLHMRQSWETMTSVSAGHIILTPTQPVGSGRPQQESNPRPPHQESRALPTELPCPPLLCMNYICLLINFGRFLGQMLVLVYILKYFLTEFIPKLDSLCSRVCFLLILVRANINVAVFIVLVGFLIIVVLKISLTVATVWYSGISEPFIWQQES